MKKFSTKADQANYFEQKFNDFFSTITHEFKLDQLTTSSRFQAIYEAFTTAVQFEFSRMDDILEGAGLGAWDWWLETNEVSFDRRWCEMLGLKLEQTVQNLSTWDERVHPEDKAKAYQDIQNYLEGKTERYENVHRLRHADGRWIWILDRGKVSAWDDTGKPIRFTGTHFEITSYKELRHLTESIQQMGHIGGWEMDAETGKTKWTPETYKIHAIDENAPTDKIMGINFFAPHERERITECVQLCLKGKSYREIFEFMDAKGKHKWVEATGEPIVDANGRVFKLMGTFQDISEKQTAYLRSEALAQENKRYREWIESSREGVWEFDIAGKTSFLNSAMAQFLGLSREEVKGRSFASFLALEKDRSFADELFNGQEIDWSRSHEFKLKTNEEHSVWLNITFTPYLDPNGRIVSIVAMSSDISELKHREAQMQSLVKSLDDVVLELDDDFVFKNVWTSDHNKLLIPTKNLVGRNYRDVLPPIFAQKLSHALEGLNYGGDQSFEFKWPTTDGKLKFYKVKVRQQGDKSQNLYTTVAISDSTAKKEASLEKEKLTLELLQVKERLQAILDNAPIATYERLRSSSWSMNFISTYIADITGYAAADFIKDNVRSYSSIIHPLDRKYVEDTISTAMVLGKSFEVKYRLMHISGETKWVLERGLISQQSENLVGVILDITNQVQNANDLDHIFNHTPDLLCIANTEGFYKRVSPSFTKVLGYSLEELTSVSFLDFVHPEDRAKTLGEIEKLAAGFRTLHFENRYLTKSGDYRLLSWVCEPDSATGLLYASARDITDLKKQEQKNKQILEAINSTTIITETDHRGVITYVNENFCKISGFSAKEVLGRSHNIVNSGVHSKEFFEKLWQTIQSGQTWSGVLENKSKSGNNYFVKSVISPIKNLNNEIESFFAVRVDITEQVNAKKSLEEAQSIAHLGNFRFNFSNYTLEWSQELFRILQIPTDTSPAKLYSEYLSRVHPDDKKELMEKIDNASRLGLSYEIRYRIILPNEEIRYLRTVTKVIKDKKGRAALLSGTVQDITEEIELQKQIAKERAKSLHSAKLASLGEMSAGIAHEINNPLTIIVGNVELLTKFKLPPDKYNEKLEGIAKASERIEKIVKGLRKFSRSTDVKHFKPKNLADIVAESLVLTEVRCKRKAVKVTLELTPNLTIFCDEIDIEQVVVNLINNAVDAISERADKWIKIKAFSRNHQIILQVIDSGTELSPEVEQKLFQPFFTTKKVGEGTGLGLSITKGILDDHSAIIRVNRDFETTCFEIIFNKYESKELKHAV